MKVIAFNGSPHPNGNTAQAIRIVLQEIQHAGFETEMIQLGGKKILGCLGCRQCAQNRNKHCVRTDDDLNAYIDKMLEADGIIIGSPVYTSNVTSEVKALIDRANFVAKANDFMFRGKVGAPVVVATKAGATFAYSAINLMFGISQMVTVGSIHWNLALGKMPGDIQKDEEGIRTFQVLGQNMVWLLKKLNCGQE
ncbi:MAG: flavodoxin family protein [Clostridia bacterium]|nr:flavodoxin family protein [Clostridia bacterium]